MPKTRAPRLRTAEKVVPPYPLNDFPNTFGLNLGKEIIYMLAVKETPSLQGEEWEKIFANCVGAEWKSSNVGLDDIQLGVCAWGAKTVYQRNPERTERVRLISGRNSPAYSFNQMSLAANPQELGDDVLDIWNARVESVRSHFSHLRTVVLVKSNDLSTLLVFEFETVFYQKENYAWTKNRNGNLEGKETNTGTHKFTWQPHGSQFTIIEDVPQKCLILNLKKPNKLDKEKVLTSLKFTNDWVSILKRS